MSLRAITTHLLNTSRDGNSTTSLGSLLSNIFVERFFLRSNLNFLGTFLSSLSMIPHPAEIWTSRIQITRHECSASLWMLTRHCTQYERIARGILLHLQCPITESISGLGLLQGISALGSLCSLSFCSSFPTGLGCKSPNCGWSRLCASQSFCWEAEHDDGLLSARGVATHAATTEASFSFFLLHSYIQANHESFITI